MSETKIDEIMVNPDTHHILAATKNHVILLGHHHYDPMIIVVLRKTYLEALSSWLDDKASYLERWGEFCGVGYMAFEADNESAPSSRGYPDETTVAKYLIDNSESNEAIHVPVLLGTSKFTVDMEHG